MKHSLLRKVRYFHDLGKPKLFWKVLRLYSGLKFFGRTPPFRNIEIQTTFACNLRCVHCSASSFRDEVGLLTLEDYRSIARQCSEHRVPFVSFTGGEPLVDPRFLDIVRCFDGSDTLLAITTNGVKLNDEMAKDLKHAGVAAVTVSLDGSTPAENDPIRGEGTFDQVMAALDVSKQHGFVTMIIHTLTRPSIENGVFNRLIELARRLDVLMHVSLACPTGNWSTKESRDEFALTRRNIEYLNQCQEQYGFLRRDIDGNFAERGCPAGTERFVISPFGDVLPCTKIQASFGNVKDEPMIDIRNRMVEMDIFSGYPPLCLVAEDDQFLTHLLPRMYGRDDLPVPAEVYFA